jgi:hypothetical protein
MIAHGAFDYIAVIDLKISAVDILTVARTVATVMLLVIHKFIMDRSVAPLDVVLPHSNTIALEEVAHCQPTHVSIASAMRSSAFIERHDVQMHSSS